MGISGAPALIGAKVARLFHGQGEMLVQSHKPFLGVDADGAAGRVGAHIIAAHHFIEQVRVGFVHASEIESRDEFPFGFQHAKEADDVIIDG